MKKAKLCHRVHFWLSAIIMIIAGIGLITGLAFASGNESYSLENRHEQGQNHKISLHDLLNIPAGELEKVDPALVNLLCAQGLPGSEELEVDKCLKVLDEWASIIKRDTQVRFPSYHQNPAKYDYSENLFKVVNMVLCLKNEIGVDYNPEIMKRTKFPDSRDVFIHGCLTGKKQGGCISIPTLCMVIGRRLGYPLKLVLTKEHVFFRWDDGKEVFNMEACCPGCDSRPDEYYKSWPRKITQKEIEEDYFLVSLTPEQELGLFLETRGHCLFDAGKTRDAQVMYAYAYKLMPSRVRLAYMNQVIRKELE